MPRVSQQRLDQTRGRILAGARVAFARHGYDGATIRVLEEQTGLSRGAIFHHFRDKDALFLALAEEDAAQLAELIGQDGLIGAMRALPERDAGWLGVQLEISRRLRTNAEFREQWQRRADRVRAATRERLRRGQAAGTVRTDVSAEILTSFLQLVHDGLVLHLAAGLPDRQAAAVLDLTEAAVRRPAPLSENGNESKERP